MADCYVLGIENEFLEPWERFETRENLVRIFNLAWWVGMVVNAFVPEQQAGYRFTAPAWLGEFLVLMERAESR